MEIATIIGRRKIECAAALHSKKLKYELMNPLTGS